MAQASSAMARIFSAPSRRMSSTGLTCRVPTDACAYQVPRVPCFSKTRVRRSVYSARCSSGTAQSSMKETGFAAPFIGHIYVLARFPHVPQILLLLRVGDLDHAAWQAEVRHQLPELLQLVRLARFAGELHQQDRVGLALDEGVDCLAECADVAREPDHR